MMENDSIRAHDNEAGDYDRQVLAYEYFTHDIIFGMGYEYVKPGERLLDLGIGTGLASLPFARLGLEIYGLDGSAEMLKVCASKNFARELKCFDILEGPLPYSDIFFSHVISCGVFHFFNDLSPLFGEVRRVMAVDGIFAFTTAVPPSGTAETGGNDFGPALALDTSRGVKIHAHTKSYIAQILQKNGFGILKRQRVLNRGDVEGRDDLIFAAYITRRHN